MKSGTNAPARSVPSRRNASGYYDDDDSRIIHTDPYLDDVHDIDIPYLGFAAGVLLDGPDDLQSPNIESWPLEQIYKLRSDLISLSIAVDRRDSEIQKLFEERLRLLVELMNDNENAEPLIIEPHMRPPSRPVTRDVRFEQLPRSVSPMSSLPTAQMFSHSKTKSESRDRNRVGSHSRSHSKPPVPPKPQLTQESLWDNVNTFMRPIENWHLIDKYLIQNEHRTDRAILKEPSGPHYSTTFARHPSVLSDPLKARLMIPPPPSEAKGTAEKNSQRHSRLIAAFVPLLGTQEAAPPAAAEDHSNVNAQMMHDIRKAEHEHATKVAETESFTEYAWLSFDQRLDMELKYVGIESTGDRISDVDCPIVQDMMETLDREETIIGEANKWRKIAAEFIEKGKPMVETRLRRHKEWQIAMNNYHAMEKAKQQLEKKEKKEKERLKHVKSTESD